MFSASTPRLGISLLTAIALAFTLALFAPAGVPVLGASQAAAGCSGSDKNPRQISQRRAKRAVLCLINKQRRKAGISRLRAKSSIGKAARRHSKRMVNTGCFSHQCPGEPDLVRRVESTSYLPCNCYWGVGENIAWGQGQRGTPRNIVKAWMNSSGHRANILSRSFEHMGVSVIWGAPGNPNAKAGVYTTVFGYRN